MKLRITIYSILWVISTCMVTLPSWVSLANKVPTHLNTESVGTWLSDGWILPGYALASLVPGGPDNPALRAGIAEGFWLILFVTSSVLLVRAIVRASTARATKADGETS